MDLDKLVWILTGIAILASVGLISVDCNQEQHPEITIDGCEYVSGYQSLAHKGNCRRCEERLQKIIKEEINSKSLRSASL